MFANVERERDWCRHVKVNIESAERQVERERLIWIQAVFVNVERDWCRHVKVNIASVERQVERERERERGSFLNFVSLLGFFYSGNLST